MACCVNRIPGSFPSAPGPSPACLSVQLAGWCLSVGQDGTLLWGQQPPACLQWGTCPAGCTHSLCPTCPQSSVGHLTSSAGCYGAAAVTTPTQHLLSREEKTLDPVEINGTRGGLEPWLSCFTPTGPCPVIRLEKASALHISCFSSLSICI